ncbi:MAG: DUF6431 domain-containing protein [Armatimonadetes bacterium]|nr:DUF6431 domain-containing protein [Armatimonadota bacterium]
MADRFFHRHGKYQRNAFTWKDSFKIFIYRFKCSTCGHTQSLLPSFIGPRQQVVWDVQEEVIQESEKGTPLNELAEKLEPPAGPYSERTLWRWKKNWEARLARVETGLWKWFLDRLPHLDLPVGEKKPKGRWGYLFQAFEQVRAHLPEVGPYRLFQWIYRFKKPLAVAP